MQQQIATAPAAWQLRAQAATARVAAWAAAERGRFALWLPVLMAAGVAGYFTLTVEPPAWASAVALVLCLGLGGLAGYRPWLRAPCWAAAAVALGFGSAQLATARAPPLVEVPSRAAIVTGTVRMVEQLPQGRRVLLEQPSLDGGAALPRAVRVRLRAGDEVAVATGDTLRVRALLMRPAPPA
ncbi:DUF4131 domain-containing protein, partial [Limobrevibacterium gyesilva]